MWAISNDGLVALTVPAGPGYVDSYVYDNGSYGQFLFPSGYRSYVVQGINDNGATVGYLDGDGTQAVEDNNGVFTEINISGIDPSNVTPSGINDSGVIVGSYTDNSGNNYGFTDNNGTISTIADPDASAANGGTTATGINDNGVVVGYYFDSSGNVHGFTDTNGVYATVDDGTGGTLITGINDDGEIVGQATVNGVTENFTATLGIVVNYFNHWNVAA